MKNKPTHEPMSAMDHLMYQFEYDAARRSGGIGIYLLDKTPTWSAVEYAFERLSREFPRFRQKVVEPLFGVGPAYWVVDPDFDIRYHARRVQLTEGATLRTILDHLEIELMSPIDLARPLWYVMLFEGLEGGRSVLALRASHCIGDGMGGMKMQEILFDTSRRARRRPMPPAPVGEHLTSAEVSAKTRRLLPRAAFGALRGLVSSVRDFSGRLLQDPKAMATGVQELAQALKGVKSDAEPSPLLEGRSLSRRVAWIELSISQLKAAARSVEGTVNDAYLAGLCGALRHYHETMGVSVSRLQMGFPINTRDENSKIEGNQFAIGMLELPIDERDAGRRVCYLHEQGQRARREGTHFDFLGAAAQIVSYLPPRTIQQLMEAMPLPGLVASNVPGPTQELFLGGARVERMIGIGPVMGGAFLAGLTAHRDTGTVAVTYDPAAICEGELFQASLEKGFAEVLSLAPPGRASQNNRIRPPAPPKKSRGARRA
jgi:diacylglycerol O-acyltransferase